MILANFLRMADVGWAAICTDLIPFSRNRPGWRGCWSTIGSTGCWMWVPGPGGFARYLREGGFQGVILSFEPLSQAHGALLEASRKDPSWYEAERMALGVEPGEVQIHISENSTSSSILPIRGAHLKAASTSRYIGTERTVLRRLDAVEHSVLKSSSRLYLKVDTQGYEIPVLRGAQAILPKVIGIQVELSLVPLYDDQELYRDVLAWMEHDGFDLWNVIPGFSDPDSGRMLQMDGVFFRR